MLYNVFGFTTEIRNFKKAKMAFSDLDRLFTKEIEAETLKGCAMYVEKDGKPLFNNVYGSDSANSIYKIYSMTKPITAVATMILYERGLLTLQDPVSKYIPAFANATVSTDLGIIPAKNTLTVQHLLDMTSGIVYPGERTQSEMIMAIKQKEMLEQVASGKKLGTLEICNILATVPLEFEPGTSWKYGASADMLGAIIEVVSGMKFGEFLKKEIFEPLEMTETGFNLQKKDLPRLAKMYSRNLVTAKCEVPDEQTISWLGLNDVTKLPNIESGGGGLFSTMHDYVNFAKMLVNNGSFVNKNGETIQILARKTFDFLCTPRNSKVLDNSPYIENLEGYKYSNLLRIMTNPEEANSNGSVGEFGWDGLPGCYFLVDPKENMILVFFQQIAQGPDRDLRSKFRQIVYASI